jgi:hypothetical protein
VRSCELREKAARKIMSGWSAFTLGMRRPELTAIGVGEWDRPTGPPEWGVIIRDLRNGDERVVFGEQEWERIKRQGLPALGVDWGEPAASLAVAPEELIQLENSPYETRQPVNRPQEPAPAPVDDTDWSMPEILAYLDFDLGEELAKDERFRPFTRVEVEALGEAIRRGTPEQIRYEWKMGEMSQPELDALVAWLWEQRRADVDSAQLTSILKGMVNIDLSQIEPRFVGREDR